MWVIRLRKLKISYANSRLATRWINRVVPFDDLCEQFRTPVRTAETVEEYPKLPKAERDRIKDVGGIVPGELRDGRRKRENVNCCSMIKLDGDKVKPGFLERFEAENRHAAVIYSTHSHTPEAPRLRIFVPTKRDMTPEETVAVTRFYAADLGIDQFDECSYLPHQLMYKPSAPSNGEYIFRRYDGEWLDPDEILTAHPNWRDITTLPTSSRESRIIQHTLKRQQDPLEKKGVIGAFNNVHYPIQDFIETELSDVYEPVAIEGRYAFITADSTAGVIIYDDKFAYSNHASDPAYGQLLNAFDLMRVHRFGDLDEKAAAKAMLEYAREDDGVKDWLARERTEKAEAAFSEPLKAVADWQKRLTTENSGRVKDTLENLELILDNDPQLSGIGYNELKSCVDFIAPPAWEPIKYPTWAENDISQLRVYLSRVYGIYSPAKTQDAFNRVVTKRKHHPIRDYLNALSPWDGTVRVETLLIDYLGAEDTPYVRAVTRKTVVAAVARVFRPGIKFDSVLVMDGPQDRGKSTLFNRLAGDEWFNDGLTLTDMQDKAGAEKLQGYWILEIGELAGMRKSDIDSVKAFISRQDDIYRASYGRVVESHPRQSIIVATVNSIDGFLRDVTGNRRFWPVKTPGGTDRHSWNITDEEVRQIWAEAVALWKQGEKLYLEGGLKVAAAKEQDSSLESDPRDGMVQEYLDRLLPDDWNDLDLGARRSFLHGTVFGKPEEGAVKREAVSSIEVLAECFGRDPTAIKKPEFYEVCVMLRKLGWKQAENKVRVPLYGNQRLWYKPDNKIVYMTNSG